MCSPADLGFDLADLGVPVGISLEVFTLAFSNSMEKKNIIKAKVRLFKC